MKKITQLILFISITGGLISCGVGSDAVSGQKLEIKFIGEYKEGDWIQIDDIKLTHFTTDTFALKLSDTIYTQKNPIDYFYETKDCKCLPTSVLFEQINNGWFAVHINRAYMSYHFAKIFNINTQSLKKENYYKFENKPGFMINGLVRIYNTEGSKVRIKTSPNYPALVTVLE